MVLFFEKLSTFPGFRLLENQDSCVCCACLKWSLLTETVHVLLDAVDFKTAGKTEITAAVRADDITFSGDWKLWTIW